MKINHPKEARVNGTDTDGTDDLKAHKWHNYKIYIRKTMIPNKLNLLQLALLSITFWTKDKYNAFVNSSLINTFAFV